MTEVWSDDPQGLPEPDARAPVLPPLQGAAPAWDDPSNQFPADDQLPYRTHAKATVREFPMSPRTGMSETAERLGSVMGTAHRQMRRGLELVRSHPAANAEQLAHEGIDRASRAMQQLEEEVYDVRRQAALKLDELSEQAEARFQQLRLQVIGAFSRSRERAEEVAARYPLQTIAAVAGVCFALGVTLRFRRPHRG